jgi:tRNA pseudouridine55 synthase
VPRVRGGSGLSGVLLLDKPGGMTSHTVVSAVRRASGELRIGHAGTLDPMATGLLVVLIGPSTRLARYLTDRAKQYHARIAFGAETTTDDADGEVTVTADVPAEALDTTFAAATLADLIGRHWQVPPAYSAVSVQGTRAYRLARRDAAPELAPRPIEVIAAELVRVDADARALDVRLTVSKGTYVRAIARDLGSKLGSAAHLASLRRLASGSLRVEDAHALAEVEIAGAAGELPMLFTDPVSALGLPALALTSEEANRVDVGASLAYDAARMPEFAEGDLVAVTAHGALRAVYVRRGELLKPRTVLGGVA